MAAATRSAACSPAQVRDSLGEENAILPAECRSQIPHPNSSCAYPSSVLTSGVVRYISTRGGIAPIPFRDAVMMGMARDGGLLLPESIPQVEDRLCEWKDLPYPELAFQIMRLFCDMPDRTLRALVEHSYSTFRHREITPVVHVDDVYVLELFHGPTLAFKDVALQFLGNLFALYLEDSRTRLNILAATSGDTGSAAIYGVRGRERIQIFVLHPRGRISRLQEQQMTSVLDPNVHNIAVEGTFDDCQGIVKTLFNDLEYRDRCSLGSVNSINWARLLAQIVYYFYGAFRVMEQTGADRVRFAVPTGNFGDIFAGYLAAAMGLPVGRLILATNENDILSRFFRTGTYGVGPVHATVTPSMDIQVASNFERYLYYRFGKSPDRLKREMANFSERGSLAVEVREGKPVDSLFSAAAGSTEGTLATIRTWQEKYGYLLDPHSAVGVDVAGRFPDDGEPVICLATAHPSKFADTIRKATGRDLARHPAMEAVKNLPTRCEVLPADVPAVRDFILERA